MENDKLENAKAQKRKGVLEYLHPNHSGPADCYASDICES
jgi:hypothetical protein